MRRCLSCSLFATVALILFCGDLVSASGGFFAGQSAKGRVPVLANGQQVIPPESGDIYATAAMSFSFDILAGTMEYSIKVTSSLFAAVANFVNDAGLYCGAPGQGEAGFGDLVAFIDANQTGIEQDGLIQSSDLFGNSCYGISIATTEGLRSAMQEGLVYLEVSVASNDGASAYIRGQVYV